jgi:hypothetical protein
LVHGYVFPLLFYPYFPSTFAFPLPLHLPLTSLVENNTDDITHPRTENLSEPGHGHFETITQYNKLFTACADGKIPWVSAGDIALVAFHALTDEKPHDCAYRILGPELLTYDEVCLLPFLQQKFVEMKRY